MEEVDDRFGEIRKGGKGGGHIPPVGETERREMDFGQSDFV